MINVGLRKQNSFSKNSVIIMCQHIGFTIGLICIILIFVHAMISIYWKDKTRMYFLDVGQGDACLITNNQNVFLIDSGGNRYMDEDNNIGSRIIFPFLLKKKIKKIDVAFISHMHYDHIKGLLELFEYIDIEKVAISCVYQALIEDEDAIQVNLLLEDLLEQCKQAGTELIYFKAGDSIIGENVEFVCYYPFSDSIYEEDENNNSMVLELKSHDNRILFTGDIEESVETIILNAYVDLKNIDILKVPHHGSKTSSSLTFIKRLNPQVAIISVGDNNHGHPSLEVLERYQDVKIPVYLTKDYGMIEVSIDSNGYIIKRYKKKDKL